MVLLELGSLLDGDLSLVELLFAGLGSLILFEALIVAVVLRQIKGLTRIELLIDKNFMRRILQARLFLHRLRNLLLLFLALHYLEILNFLLGWNLLHLLV